MDRDENQADDVTDEAAKDETPETASPIEESKEAMEAAEAQESDATESEAEDTAASTDDSVDDEEAEEAEDADFVPDPEDEDEPVAVVVRQRSAPRYGSFIGVGAILGALIALVLFVALPSDGGSSPVTALLYLVIVLAPLTALLGGLLAVIFEKRSK